ncbi:hypothetical protein KR032_004626 [Drosophila birchii]|nr:hypothetical protein KR032_004626 [Drosophila birchii]
MSSPSSAASQVMADVRGVKHFDRRFVASNLKNLLHCPGCSRDYTHTCSKGEQNRRPYLLPCGHSLCESCLSKDRQHLTCAVCKESARPLINAKNPDCKSGVRVWDFYELNYHVLGEACSLINFRNLDTEPVNDALSLSLVNEVIIQATKCSECRRADAKGECLQCNAFYCRDCFDAVHKHSRVLKIHTFQKMFGRQSKGFRVGKQVFRMPFQTVCNGHQMPMTIYCTDCRRNICTKCWNIYHRIHRTTSLSDMNQRLVSEIPCTLQSLNAALMNIHNGQEVVRAAKQKLSNYASETLASVSNYFCHLHGLLQVAEQQVVEELRESSLPPQMELNEAMGMLSGYEALIKRLMQHLNNGEKTKTGVSNNVRLEEIISLADEHLQKIPNTVQVSQIKMNPYRIYSEYIDMASIVHHKFKCKFVNPNIKVSFKTDFDGDRSVSSINKSMDNTFSLKSSNGKENACRLSNISAPRQQYHHRPLSQKSNFNSQKRGPSTKSSNSSLNSTAATIDSFQPRNHHQPDFVGSFSALGITKPHNATREADKWDWIKTDAVVNVRTINSPEDFYVQGVNAAQLVREELEKITHSLTDGRCTPPEIVVGQHYVIFHQDHKRYYRVMVSQKMATQNTYKVFLPDVGTYAEMHNSHFREMPANLSHIPYSAVHCKLSELMPGSGANSEWVSEAITHFKQIVKNNSVHLIVKKAPSLDLYEVDLITKNFISVRESFLYSGLARSRCGRPPAAVLKSLEQIAPAKLCLHKPKIQTGDIFMIQMMHVEHPQEFYVMRHDIESERSLKQSNLQIHMDRLDLSKLENIFLGRLHLGCVVQLNDVQWKRASIEEILPDGYVLVRLVDDGPCQKVFWDKLFVLPPGFWEPERTIKCTLADVETLPDSSYVWTPEATAFFKQLTSNPKLYLEVINFTPEVVTVALRFTRGGSETTNVAVQMVAQGHCTSSGESSRIFSNAQIPQRSTRFDFDTRQFLDQQKMQAVQLTPFRETQKVTKDRNKGVKVIVLYVRHPDEFYVTLPEFQSQIVHLQESVQTAAEDMYRNQIPRTDWKVGDMCYVKVKAQSDLDILWHRGVVTNVSSFSRYHVQLRDFGQVVEDVPSSCMTNIDEFNLRISSSAYRCHLHGVQALGSEWSLDAINFFKEQLQDYDPVYVVSQGGTDKSQSVILWGTRTVVRSPFSPAHTKFVNINKTLLRKNFAAKNENDSQQPMLDYVSFSSDATTTARDKKTIQNWMNKIDNFKSVCSQIDAPKVRTGFEHNEDMPPLELLDDLGKNQVTTGQTVAPAAWTTPRKCDKSIFTGFATYVNQKCSVYFCLGNDKPYLEHMRKLLDIHYKPLMEKQQQENRSYTYEVGQPVVVTYHMDSLLYRGIVKRVRKNYHEYKVYYVDYGNMELVKADEMLPYAPFPQLNAMCWLVDIHGVRPIAQKYTRNQMDTVHRELVMKLSSVNVMEPRGVGESDLPTCKIKVGNVDIATMMIDCGFAIPTESTHQASTQKSTSQQQELAFGVFEELKPDGRNEANSSLQQPLAKKKYMVYDQDFDCQQAAQDMYHNSSFVSADSVGYSGGSQAEEFNIEDNEEEEQSTDYSGHEMDIDIEGEESTDTESSDSSSDEMEMKPLSVSTVNQLQRRIDQRHKDMKETVSFSPNDTSSVRSYFDGSNSFKTLRLPTGVKEFECSVKNVLSAVELQIAPNLAEFAKHELTLDKETCLLIEGAAALANPKLNDLCLARHSKDKRWYRAVVKEIQESTQQATVFYIDFHDTEQVSYTRLKEMPKKLFMFPLRCFHVKLHGVKKNRNVEDKEVRHCLRDCLYKYARVFARVHYPFNYHANKSANSEDGKFDLIEVELFENKHKKKLVYQSLIDSQKLVHKKYK